MPHIKLTTGRMVGDEWKEKGAVIEVSGRLAELHVKAGTGIAVSAPPAVEQATAIPHGEQAVAPRQHRPGK